MKFRTIMFGIHSAELCQNKMPGHHPCHRWVVVFIKLSGFTCANKAPKGGSCRSHHWIWPIEALNLVVQTKRCALMCNEVFLHFLAIPVAFSSASPDGNFSLVYDDDAANKFQLFCIYFSLLSFSCVFKAGRDRQTMRSIKSSSTQEFRHQFPPFKNFFPLKMGNKKIISFYEFFFFLCNNRWWYRGWVGVTSRSGCTFLDLTFVAELLFHFILPHIGSMTSFLNQQTRTSAPLRPLWELFMKFIHQSFGSSGKE